jgi:putative membrane protein
MSSRQKPAEAVGRAALSKDRGMASDRPGFWEQMLEQGRSRTLGLVSIYAILVGLYSTLAVWKEYSSFSHLADTPAEIHAAITVVLGWLLVFRTNTAYARWWEARTLWGQLVNIARNTAIKTSQLVNLPEDSRQHIQRVLVAFPYVLRDHLRGESSIERVSKLLPPDMPQRHVPSALIARLYRVLENCRAAGKLDGDELRIIDTDLRAFLDVCGGCERIRNTRIARSYRVFARQCVFFFLATFPWGIVESCGAWTIPLTTIIAYFMLGMETVAEHVEEPFGLDEDDLDLDVLCESIERNVDDIFRTRPFPGERGLDD